MQYQCEATTVEGFIQQLAVQYITHGYFYFVTGVVPDGKDPRAVDRKLLERYGIDRSKWSRARVKRAGRANLHYIRHERFFVLAATDGEHPFFSEERATIRDVRTTWLKAFGYEIGYRNGHTLVRIEREEHRRLRAHLLELATHRTAEVLAAEVFGLPYQPYRPVYRQLLRVVWELNDVRRLAGYEPVRSACVRRNRSVVRPFAPLAPAEEAA